MSQEPAKWDVGKLDLKPGQILVVRWTPPELPGVGGTYKPDLNSEYVQEMLTDIGDKIRSALDAIGLTSDKVPVLVCMNDIEFMTMGPLDLIDICTTATKAAEEE